MGNNHSNNHTNNDYRPDPTRTDRIRGGGDGKVDNNGGAKKNGYRTQLSAGQSPSHGVVGVPVLPVPPSVGGRYSLYLPLLIFYVTYNLAFYLVWLSH